MKKSDFEIVFVFLKKQGFTHAEDCWYAMWKGPWWFHIIERDNGYFVEFRERVENRHPDDVIDFIKFSRPKICIDWIKLKISFLGKQFYRNFEEYYDEHLKNNKHEQD